MRNPLWAYAAFLALMAGCIAAQHKATRSQKDLAQRQTQFWLAIRRSLTGPNGAAYFGENLRYAEVPGGADGLWVLKGTVISSKPAAGPVELTLAIVAGANPEALLLLKSEWKKPIPSGTEVAFSGIPKTFTADPFLLTFDALNFEVLSPTQKGPGLQLLLRSLAQTVENDCYGNRARGLVC